jgi:hypothetical protein
MSDPAQFADGQPAAATKLSFVREVALGPDGLVYIAGGGTVRRIGADGRIATVVTDRQMNTFVKLAIDREGAIFYDTSIGIRKAAPGGALVTIAGYGTSAGVEDGAPATGRHIQITGLAVGPEGDIYFSDFLSRSAWRLDSGGIAHRVAGPAPQGDSAFDLVFDPAGRLYILYDKTTVRLERDGTPTPIPFPIRPAAMTFRSDGSIFIADSRRVYRVNSDFTLAVIAGTDQSGFSNGCGSGANPGTGDALTARFRDITSIKFDGAGNLAGGGRT